MRHKKDGPARSTALGKHLQQLRKMSNEDQSIRKVAKKTGISNAYLSQLERGVAENPSPHVLHKLAEHYGAAYETLMAAAGYVRPSTKENEPEPSSLELLLKSAKLSKAEEEDVKKFIIHYLRSK
jgi:HTH-type transcriptional regulator, competence development regulator